MYSPNDKKGFNFKDLIVIIIVAIAIYHVFIKEETIVYRDGILAEGTPIQNKIEGEKMFYFKDYGFEKLASYKIKAKVLSRKTYNSELSPIDLALGWSKMSNEEVIKDLDISQSGRWYHYSWKDTSKLKITPREIIRSSANTHIIPANKIVEQTALNIRRGEFVEMSGYLVKVTGKNGFRWKSSTTRNDSGNGGCEVFYVETIKVVQP